METRTKLSSAEVSRRYRERHPEKVKQAQKAWREKNKDKLKEKNCITNGKRSKEQHRDYMRVWRKNNPHLAKNADLKKCYGISLAEYKAKLIQQNGQCAVCGNGPGARSLAVDHNHQTNQVRDLLCHRCNTAIGLVDEDINKLQSLVNYLKRWE